MLQTKNPGLTSQEELKIDVSYHLHGMTRLAN